MFGYFNSTLAAKKAAEKRREMQQVAEEAAAAALKAEEKKKNEEAEAAEKKKKEEEEAEKKRQEEEAKRRQEKAEQDKDIASRAISELLDFSDQLEKKREDAKEKWKAASAHGGLLLRKEDRDRLVLFPDIIEIMDDGGRTTPAEGTTLATVGTAPATTTEADTAATTATTTETKTETNTVAATAMATTTGSDPTVGPESFFYCPPCDVPPNIQQPAPGERKAGFMDVSAIVQGAQNVILNGPWVTFWCADCGRQLASRSIHEHWSKSHGDKNNLAGLQNVATHAMSEYLIRTGKRRFPSPDASDKDGGGKHGTAKRTKRASGPQLMGVRTSAQAKNPFFTHIDNTPPAILTNYSEDDLKKLAVNLCTSQKQLKDAMSAINNYFCDA